MIEIRLNISFNKYLKIGSLFLILIVMCLKFIVPNDLEKIVTGTDTTLKTNEKKLKIISP